MEGATGGTYLTSFKRFPFGNFTYLSAAIFWRHSHLSLTLLHTLSVSRSYLALDGIYHPFEEAIPNFPTLRVFVSMTVLVLTTGQ